MPRVHSELSVSRQQDPCRADMLPMRVTSHSIQLVNGSRTVGRANRYLYSLAGDTFAPANPQGTTRLGKFMDSLRGGVRRGAGVGAGLGCVATFVPDVAIGNADPSYKGCGYNVRAEGVVGVITHAAIDVASVTSTAPGAVGGLVGGLFTSPCASTVSCLEGDTTTPDHVVTRNWVRNSVELGAAVTSTPVAAAAGASTGLALGVARAPFTVVKGALAFAGATVGGVVGFFVGIGRAIANR